MTVMPGCLCVSLPTRNDPKHIVNSPLPPTVNGTVVCVQVAASQSGSLVYKIDPLAPAHDVLKENDVVMQIDGVPIADDGTVEFRNEERVEFSHIVRAKHIGVEPSSGTLSCIPFRDYG